MNEPSQRPTSETDEIAVLSPPLNYSDGYVRLRDHARTLERQRDEAREQVSKLVASLEWIRANSKTHEGRRAERDLRAILAETKEAE